MTEDPEDRGFHVCLFGASLDVGNMGCRALAVSLIQLVLEARPDARVFLLYGNRYPSVRELRISEETVAKVEVVNFRLSPRARLREHLLWILFLACIHRFVSIRALRERICESTPWLKCLKRADFVGGICGGDSFADLYGLRRFLIGAVPNLVALLMEKDLVLLPQTYGPYRSPIARKIARFIMMRAQKIHSRDTGSIEIVRELLGKKARGKAVQFCPDVAFSLKAIEPRRVTIEPPLDRRSVDVLVGLNVSGLLYMGGYTRGNMFGLRCDYQEFVRDLVVRLLATPGTHVLLVPHAFGSAGESDQGACRKVWESVADTHRDRTHLVTGEYDQNEIKAIIGRCDFFVGSRMHACIAALSQGIATIGVAYSRKFVGVFDSVGMGSMVLDAQQLSGEELLEGCMVHFRNRGIVAESLRGVVPQIRSQLETYFGKEVLGVGEKKTLTLVSKEIINTREGRSC